MKRISCLLLAFLLCLSACSAVSPVLSGSESSDGTIDTTATGSTIVTTSTTQGATSSFSTAATTTKAATTRDRTSRLCKGYIPSDWYEYFVTVDAYRDFLLKMRTYQDYRTLCKITSNSNSRAVADRRALSMLLQDRCFPIPVIKDAPQIRSVHFWKKGYSTFHIEGDIEINVYHGKFPVTAQQETPNEPCPFHVSHDSSYQYDSGSFVTDKGLHVEKCLKILPDSDHYGDVVYGILFLDKYWIIIQPTETYDKETVQMIENILDHLTIEIVEIP